jgi:glycine/D-amino acid oxidase-like deaminating enzyme
LSIGPTNLRQLKDLPSALARVFFPFELLHSCSSFSLISRVWRGSTSFPHTPARRQGALPSACVRADPTGATRDLQRRYSRMARSTDWPLGATSLSRSRLPQVWPRLQARVPCAAWLTPCGDQTSPSSAQPPWPWSSCVRKKRERKKTTIS